MVVSDLKYFYYPSVNIHESNLNLGRHIKTIPTICLLGDYRKYDLYGQFSGELFSDCHQVKIVPNRAAYVSIAHMFTTFLLWTMENLPEEEIVLLPSSGAGTYSYWSNLDSAALAKLSLS